MEAPLPRHGAEPWRPLLVLRVHYYNAGLALMGKVEARRYIHPHDMIVVGSVGDLARKPYVLRLSMYCQDQCMMPMSPMIWR